MLIRHRVDSEAYSWKQSGFFWRMRASLSLACAQTTTLCSQVFGKANPRFRAGGPRALRCLSSSEVTVTSHRPPRLCRFAVFLIQTNVLSLDSSRAHRHVRKVRMEMGGGPVARININSTQTAAMRNFELIIGGFSSLLTKRRT